MVGKAAGVVTGVLFSVIILLISEHEKSPKVAINNNIKFNKSNVYKTTDNEK